MDIVYDVANKDDIDELVRLRIAYTREDLGSLSEDDERMMRSELPGFFKIHLNQDTFSFVARADGHIVAQVILIAIFKPISPKIPSGLCGEVLSVYTEPEYRGKGICSQLMKNMIDAGRQLGMCRITLAATNDGYPVYKKAGFEDKVTKYKDMILNL